MQYSEANCDFQNLDLTLKKYGEVFKGRGDNLDPTMAAFFRNELNVKIKKNIICLISHKVFKNTKMLSIHTNVKCNFRFISTF